MEEMRQIREFRGGYVVILNYRDLFCKYKILKHSEFGSVN